MRFQCYSQSREPAVGTAVRDRPGNAPIHDLWRLSGIVPGKPGTMSLVAL